MLLPPVKGWLRCWALEPEVGTTRVFGLIGLRSPSSSGTSRGIALRFWQGCLAWSRHDSARQRLTIRWRSLAFWCLLGFFGRGLGMIWSLSRLRYLPCGSLLSFGGFCLVRLALDIFQSKGCAFGYMNLLDVRCLARRGDTCTWMKVRERLRLRSLGPGRTCHWSGGFLRW